MGSLPPLRTSRQAGSLPPCPPAKTSTCQGLRGGILSRSPRRQASGDVPRPRSRPGAYETGCRSAPDPPQRPLGPWRAMCPSEPPVSWCLPQGLQTGFALDREAPGEFQLRGASGGTGCTEHPPVSTGQDPDSRLRDPHPPRPLGEPGLRLIRWCLRVWCPFRKRTFTFFAVNSSPWALACASLVWRHRWPLGSPHPICQMQGHHPDCGS